ncbi:TATA-box binding protein associated factor 12 [Chelydra serpentina]|uniref:Transcription initiation factor TFIID subunit 12 n=8 Tax=Durocryptodira TaxID=1579337 RepID=A0A8T1STF9_CHESE|nr:TATA-box binding protein associated factor 12 [Chelydra serpentina]
MPAGPGRLWLAAGGSVSGRQRKDGSAAGSGRAVKAGGGSSSLAGGPAAEHGAIGGGAGFDINIDFPSPLRILEIPCHFRRQRSFWKMASPFTGPTAVADVIKDLDTQIALIGLGPHNPKKKQDLDKLYDLKTKAQQIMNQFGPSTLINLSSFSSIKPEPANTPPQSSMANSTTVAKMPGTPSGGGRLSPESNQVLTKKKLQDLVREVDPNEQLDEDVEEMLLQIADDFIESVVTAACQLARHRKSNTLEVKDVQLHLERQWNMWIPGFGSEEIRPYKKACTTEAHKQRMALIRKTTKK